MISYGQKVVSKMEYGTAPLKGFLILKNKELKKVHDVVALLNDCINLDAQFKELVSEVQTVYPYYIETRYPSYEEVDIFTKEQAQEAYQDAEKVLEFVKEKMPSYFY